MRVSSGVLVGLTVALLNLLGYGALEWRAYSQHQTNGVVLQDVGMYQLLTSQDVEGGRGAHQLTLRPLKKGEPFNEEALLSAASSIHLTAGQWLVLEVPVFNSGTLQSGEVISLYSTSSAQPARLLGDVLVLQSGTSRVVLAVPKRNLQAVVNSAASPQKLMAVRPVR